MTMHVDLITWERFGRRDEQYQKAALAGRLPLVHRRVTVGREEALKA